MCIALSALCIHCGDAAHQAAKIQQERMSTPQPNLGLRFLALGDSYTIGESVEPAGRWPVQLVELLRKEGVAISDPQIIATTGWTTDELAAAIAKEKPVGTFDLVSLLIGVNNQYRGRDVEEYRTEFRSLLRQALSFAGNKPECVVVISIPDWGVTPFAEGRDRKKITAEIDAFNMVNKEESVSAGVHYADITPISRQATNDPALIAPDGLHPSRKMYEAWTELLLPIVLPQLKRPVE